MRTTTPRVVDVPGLFDSRPLGYSQCVVAGDIVHVAGQGGLDASLQIVSPDFEAQARQALMNLRSAVEAAGAAVVDMSAMTVYLTDISTIRLFGALKREVLGDIPATSTTVEVSPLALPGMLVEVSATAVLPSS